MKRHTLSILLALATPLLLLSSCKKESLSVTPDLDPVTPTVNGEGKIVLAEPVTLTIGTTPMQVVDPLASTRSLGDFYGDYSDADRDAATVNSTKEQDQIHRSTAWNQEGGTDWMRTLVIDGLEAGKDYVVDGLVSESSDRTKPIPNYREGRDDEIVPQSQKVSLTLYKIPADKRLCIYVNSYGWDDVYYPENQKTASNKNPYMSAFNGALFGDNATFIDPSYYLDTRNRTTIFNSFYLPMYGEVRNLEVSGEGKLMGTQFGETQPRILDNIFVERSVAMVQIDWTNRDEEFKPLADYVFALFEVGWFVNAFSVRPNNYDGLLSAAKAMCTPYDNSWSTPIKNRVKAGMPFYRYRYTSLSLSGAQYQDYRNLYKKTSCEGFFVPENMTSFGVPDNTLRVTLFKADHSKEALVLGDDGKPVSKVFELKYGTKVGNRYEVHRNTLYRLHLRLKQTPEGVIPYIVPTWTDQPVDIPW